MKPKGRKSDLVRAGELLLPGFEEFQPDPARPEQAPLVTPALTVQGKHHYTRIKQIDALAGLVEDPGSDMGFMARLLTLCSLPRTNPGNRLQYKRQNGPYKLIMIAGGDNKLPFGNLPRLLLAWVCTEAVRTRGRDLTLGKSLAAFMRELGIMSDSGGSRGDRTRLKNQIDRLFHCQVELIYESPGRKRTASSRVADSTDLWWDYRQPGQDTLWESRIRLGEAFFNEIIAHPVPLNVEILRKMRRSSLGLDLYMWLSYKTFSLYNQGKKPERLGWDQLYRQFGAKPEEAGNKYVLRDFRNDVKREFKKLQECWPALDLATPPGCLEIRPCAPSVAPVLTVEKPVNGKSFPR
jgi:Plasmid encoded RepA protein